MIFGKQFCDKHKLKRFKLNINKYCIKEVNEIKYSGIILDNKLSWQNRINHICVKLSRAAGVIFKLRSYLPQKATLLLYNSLAAHYLRYGITAWGAANSSLIKKVQVLQNKIVRYLSFSLPRSTSAPLYHALNLMNSLEMYHFEPAKYMFDMYNYTIPIVFK